LYNECLPDMSDTSEAASVQTGHPAEQKSGDVKSAKTINERWKDLDAIFQAQLKECVKIANRGKFDALASKLGFDASDRGDLFECIQTFLRCLYPPALSPLNDLRYVALSSAPRPHLAQPPAADQNEPSPNSVAGTVDSKHSFYAIPNNKNERISGSKRKRSELNEEPLPLHDEDDDDEFTASDDDDMTSPKRKKRKIPNADSGADDDHDDGDSDNVWTKNDGSDVVLTKEDEAKLAEQSVYVVEDILSHRKVSGKKYLYHVKWDGYDDTTWEPKHNLNDKTISEYWESKGADIDAEGAMEFMRQKQREQRRSRKKEKTKLREKKKRKQPASKKRRKSKPKKNKSPKKKAKDTGSDTPAEGDYPCAHCGKVFTKSRSRAAHMSVHYRDGTIKRKKEGPKEDPAADAMADSDDEETANGDNQPYWEDDSESDDEHGLVVHD